MARVAPDKRETSSASPHSTLDETLDGVCMLKFMLFACLITKGGTHQECAPSAIYQTQAECYASAAVVEDDAMRDGFFVAAVCVEVE